MLTSLEEAKRHGARIIAVNPLPETGMLRVVNPDPQDYPNLLTYPFKVLGDGAALADLYLPVRINGDVALIKALLKYMFEEEGKGGRQESTVRLSPNTQKGLRLSARCTGSRLEHVVERDWLIDGAHPCRCDNVHPVEGHDLLLGDWRHTTA